MSFMTQNSLIAGLLLSLPGSAFSMDQDPLDNNRKPAKPWIPQEIVFKDEPIQIAGGAGGWDGALTEFETKIYANNFHKQMKGISGNEEGDWGKTPSDNELEDLLTLSDD